MAATTLPPHRLISGFMAIEAFVSHLPKGHAF
jgi:hypothetical protein